MESDSIRYSPLLFLSAFSVSSMPPALMIDIQAFRSLVKMFFCAICRRGGRGNLTWVAVRRHGTRSAMTAASDRSPFPCGERVTAGRQAEKCKALLASHASQRSARQSLRKAQGDGCLCSRVFGQQKCQRQCGIVHADGHDAQV